MTDEIAKDFGSKAYISHFISAGPKAYCILIKSSTDADAELKKILKLKGFPQTVALEENLNFVSLRDQIQQYIKDQKNAIAIPVDYIHLTRTSKHEMLTLKTTKNFTVTYDKRIILPDATTLPRGY